MANGTVEALVSAVPLPARSCATGKTMGKAPGEHGHSNKSCCGYGVLEGSGNDVGLQVRNMVRKRREGAAWGWGTRGGMGIQPVNVQLKGGSGSHLLLTGILPDGPEGSARRCLRERRKSPLREGAAGVTPVS